MAETLDNAKANATAAFNKAVTYLKSLQENSTVLTQDPILVQRQDNFEHITRFFELIPEDDLRRYQNFKSVVDWLLFDHGRMAYIILTWQAKPPKPADHILITNMLERFNTNKLLHLGYGKGVTKEIGMFFMEIMLNTPHDGEEGSLDDDQPPV